MAIIKIDPVGNYAVRLTFDDRSEHVLAALSPEEFSALCEVLRSGKAVHYDPSKDTLSTDTDFAPPTK